MTNNGAKARAACPAHGGDRKDALLITDGPTRVLLHCFTRGCDGADILDAIGLTVADRYHEPRATSYEYTDFSGLVLRTVTRERDKKFLQKIRDESVVPLYHLPKLVKAVSSGEPVYLVEGEEDVHALEAVGVTATTAPMGADSFPKVDAEPLRGATVIAIVDKDSAGQTWAGKVSTKLAGVAASVEYRQAKVGKDASDHIAAELELDDLEELEEPDSDEQRRKIVLTAASDIKPRRVRWLWDGRLALGTLALLAGREGLGKSTIGYWLAAQITRGTLPGEYHGQARGVLVCATEDSWAETIVPRLIAADADLALVHRVEVIADTVHVGLSMPRDLPAVKRAARDTNAALMLLDPLLSRLDDRLDTHKDAEVRLALEPLVAMTEQAGMAALGLIHHNKSGSSDPLQLVMASKAFPAVSRSVHTVVSDPDDETGNRRLFGTPKNNLGRTDLPTLSYSIESFPVPTDDGTAWTGRLVWGEESTATIAEAMRRATESPEQKSATTEAAEWLEDYLTANGGNAASADIKQAGARAGHSYDSLKRARQKIGSLVESSGFPRRTYWLHPSESKLARQSEQQSEQNLRGESLTALTALTEGQRAQSEQSEQSEQVSKTVALTAAPTVLQRIAPGPCQRCRGQLLTMVQQARGTCGPCHLSLAVRSA